MLLEKEALPPVMVVEEYVVASVAMLSEEFDRKVNSDAWEEGEEEEDGLSAIGGRDTPTVCQRS